jgi:hypothetical protein
MLFMALTHSNCDCRFKSLVGHLLDDKLATIPHLLIEVGKVGVQFACQNQVVEQKRICFFQVSSVHPPPLPDRAVIAFQQFDNRNVVIPGKDIIKTVCFVMNSQF